MVGYKDEYVTVVEFDRYTNQKTKWKCICHCGNIVSRDTDCIIKKRIKKCKKCPQKKGLNILYPKEYECWRGIKSRCNNPKKESYKYYGARGITVSERWATFKNFFNDMGQCPEGYSIDRINNDLGYSIENCRWSDNKTQGRNKRTNKYYTAFGRYQIMEDWAREFNIKVNTLYCRLKSGMNIEEALKKPIDTRFTQYRNN